MCKCGKREAGGCAPTRLLRPQSEARTFLSFRHGRTQSGERCPAKTLPHQTSPALTAERRRRLLFALPPYNRREGVSGAEACSVPAT